MIVCFSGDGWYLSTFLLGCMYMCFEDEDTLGQLLVKDEDTPES